MTSLHVTFVVGMFALLLLGIAWHERHIGNSRDAKALGVLGTGTALASAAIAFFA